MNKLILGIKLLNTKSTIEKILIKIVNKSSLSSQSSYTNLPKSKYIDTLIKELNEHQTNDEYIHIYINFMKKQKEWLSIINLLLISHMCIINVGDKFGQLYTTLLPEQFKWMLEQNKKISQREYTHVVLINGYHKYLFQLAKHYPALKRCKEYQLSYIIEAINKQQLSVLQDLTIMSQTLRLIVRIRDCFTVIMPYKVESSRMIFSFVFKNSIEFYNILSRIINATIGTIFNMESEAAFYMDNIYRELIKCTDTIKNFENYKKDLINGEFPNAELYKVDIEFNKKLEKHMESLKNSTNSIEIISRKKAIETMFGVEEDFKTKKLITKETRTRVLSTVDGLMLPKQENGLYINPNDNLMSNNIHKRYESSIDCNLMSISSKSLSDAGIKNIDQEECLTNRTIWDDETRNVGIPRNNTCFSNLDNERLINMTSVHSSPEIHFHQDVREIYHQSNYYVDTKKQARAGLLNLETNSASYTKIETSKDEKQLTDEDLSKQRLNFWNL